VGGGDAVRCAACRGSDLRLRFRVRGRESAHGFIPTTDAYGVALDDIVRCARCGHMQLAHAPGDEELLPLYSEAEADHYVEEEAGQRATAAAALEAIERHVPRGRLLDLGCWVGFLLAEARDRGWDVAGVEPSAFAASYAREELRLPVQQADLFTADLPERAYDAVVLGDVIEHLPDPGAALERIATLLRPGGVLYLALPDAGSLLARAMGSRWWSVIPTHVQYFTRSSLRTLLGRAGYETLHVATAPKTFSVRYYVWRLGGYSGAVARGLTAAAAAAGVAERQWTPDFRDRIAVVARAPSGIGGGEGDARAGG
jgi:SAM-dependent methyltransferase